MLEFKNIVLYYEDKLIFDNLSLKIKRGSKVCISGPSGKGKTSLLMMLLGIIQPQSGTTKINGKTITPNTISNIRKQIAWLPQNIDIPVNSGYELCKLLSIKSENETILYLKKLGLSPDILYKAFTEISGGEKQRIIIAICLSLNKPILILDEPTSALDNESIYKLIHTISELKDLTVISASHNAKWVMSCDNIIKI